MSTRVSTRLPVHPANGNGNTPATEQQLRVRQVTVLRTADYELLLKRPLEVTDYAGDGYFLAASAELDSIATGQTEVEAQELFEALVVATYRRFTAPDAKLMPKAQELLRRIQSHL